MMIPPVKVGTISSKPPTQFVVASARHLFSLQSADDACEHVGLRMSELETEIKELRGRQAEQLLSLQKQHSRYSPSPPSNALASPYVNTSLKMLVFIA